MKKIILRISTLLLMLAMSISAIYLFAEGDEGEGNEEPDDKIDLLIVYEPGFNGKSFYLKSIITLTEAAEFSASFNSNYVTVDVYNYQGTFSVEISSQNSAASVFDMFDVNGSGTFYSNISHLPSDTYHITISADQQTYSGRFVLD